MHPSKNMDLHKILTNHKRKYSTSRAVASDITIQINIQMINDHINFRNQMTIILILFITGAKFN